MGKFNDVLLFSDYDDTLYNHRLEVSAENKAAIHYFIREGGRFSIATGRAHRTFTPQIAKEGLEFNAPVVLSNGAAIYDYSQDRYLVRTQLTPDTPERVEQLCGEFPDLAFEAYFGEEIYVHNPNVVTMKHLERVAVPYHTCSVDRMPRPWNKVIMEQDGPYLRRVQQYLLERWGGDYEAIFSNKYLLELTDKGSNKGAMVAKVARMLSIPPERVYCIGDNQNDIPMLALSAIPFAPANCAQQVKDWAPGCWATATTTPSPRPLKSWMASTKKRTKNTRSASAERVFYLKKPRIVHAVRREIGRFAFNCDMRAAETSLGPQRARRRLPLADMNALPQTVTCQR